MKDIESRIRCYALRQGNGALYRLWDYMIPMGFTESDCMVFSRIDTLCQLDTYCFANNAELASVSHVSVSQVSKSIRKLKDNCYITTLSFDGRVRKIKVEL